MDQSDARARGIEAALDGSFQDTAPLRDGRRCSRSLGAVAKATGETAAAIRAKHGGVLRRLCAWIGWHEGLVTLRSIAASLRLRSEGHISNLIKRCDGEFGENRTLLSWLDASLATLRA